ncbi:MAG: type III secretion system inner membrane ring subunit SctD [Puniceicoccales bacterium]|jgi:type III secretion system YscD/HrpQ family protein|nr:type III secretion system inner membrane ring subunit SctD [Puniceicoccales bacterium]
MTDKNSPEFLLKILSGNHQGAEIVFGCETAVIGNDISGDVVLSDSLISPRHVEITFAETGVTLKPLNSKVFVDGKLVKDEVFKVEELQFITIGATHIVIGPAHETWPAISAGDAPQIEEDGDIKDEPSAIEIDDKITASGGSVAKIRKKKTWIYGVGALLVATFAIALLFFMSMFSEPEKVVKKPDTFALLQSLIRELGLTNDVIISRTDTGFVASGYVTSNSELAKLRDGLLAIDPLVRKKIYSEEKILSDINTLLGHIPSHPKVQPAPNGAFLLTGYAYDANEWSKTRKRIVEDVVGITDLQDEVILPQRAFNLSRPIIAKYKLAGKVGILPQLDGIVLGGIVSGDEEENWKLAKSQLEKTFGRDVLVKNFVKVSDPEVIKHQYFGSEVNSVSISENGMNWVSFKDGAKYMVGATLSNGYSIKDITPDHIVLTKDNQTIILRIGELK